jgi:hypothetical protein
MTSFTEADDALATRAPVLIDGTGLTTTVPLVIKNAKSESGVELWYTGTTATGYDLMNASGALKGGVAIAAAANDWITGSAADDIVVHTGTSKKILLGLKGAAAPTVSIDPATGTVALLGASASLTATSNGGTGNGGVAVFSASGGYISMNAYSNSVAGTTFGLGTGGAAFITGAGNAGLGIGTVSAIPFLFGYGNAESARLGTGGHMYMTAHRFETVAGAAVAAAATLTLGADGNFFSITGNTNIDFITTTNWQAGSEVTLQFSGTPTVNHNTGAVPGGTASVLLAGAVGFALTANDTLTLIYNGTNWCEKARAVI